MPVSIYSQIDPEDIADAMDVHIDFAKFVNRFGQRHMPHEEWIEDVVKNLSRPGAEFIRRLYERVEKANKK